MVTTCWLVDPRSHTLISNIQTTWPPWSYRAKQEHPDSNFTMMQHSHECDHKAKRGNPVAKWLAKKIVSHSAGLWAFAGVEPCPNTYPPICCEYEEGLCPWSRYVSTYQIRVFHHVQQSICEAMSRKQLKSYLPLLCLHWLHCDVCV